jgi:hypothetical protein
MRELNEERKEGRKEGRKKASYPASKAYVESVLVWCPVNSTLIDPRENNTVFQVTVHPKHK